MAQMDLLTEANTEKMGGWGDVKHFPNTSFRGPKGKCTPLVQDIGMWQMEKKQGISEKSFYGKSHRHCHGDLSHLMSICRGPFGQFFYSMPNALIIMV